MQQSSKRTLYAIGTVASWTEIYANTDLGNSILINKIIILNEQIAAFFISAISLICTD